MRRVRAHVALGSNRGDSAAIFEAALRALATAEGVELVRRSTFRRTRAVGGPVGQGDFLNAVVSLDTELEPAALLALLHRIEADFGRRRGEEPRWGPRTLDLDLLTYAELELESEPLHLPHPRLEQRRFVLEPLAEIAPELVLPGSGRSVRAALEALQPEPTPGPREPRR